MNTKTGQRGPGRPAGLTLRLALGLLLVVLTSCGASSRDMMPAADQPADQAEPRPAQTKFVAPDGEPYARLGSAVAVTQGLAAVGAPGSQADPAPGRVYLYSTTEPDAHPTTLRNEWGSPGSLFGAAVAADGDTVVVGAAFDSADGDRAGAAYVFRRAADGWTLEARLAPGTPAALAHFGESVAVSGGTVVVGAPGPGAGAVFVFDRGDDGWHETAVLRPSAVDSLARFGSALDLDGGVLAVGSWTTSESEPGRAYLFERTAAGWKEAWSVESGATRDRFGYSVAVSEAFLAVGAPGGDAAPAVHVFDRNGASAALLEPPASEASGYGIAVALDGDLLAVAAPTSGRDAAAAGEIHLYALEGGVWEGRGIVGAPDPSPEKEYGASVAVSGGSVLVGAPGDGQAGPSAGAAYHLGYDGTAGRVE